MSGMVIEDSDESGSDPDEPTDFNYESDSDDCSQAVHRNDANHFSNATASFRWGKKQDSVTLAVIQKDFDALKRLCGGAKWYKFVQPDTGNSLLHIAVSFGRTEVFQHLLSISDFPVNHQNKYDLTALDFCFDSPCRLYDHFACELIKKGALMKGAPFIEDNETMLHFAIQNSLVRLAKLLMDRGYDVNAPNGRGITPLWMCLDETHTRKQVAEMATALLAHGANPSEGYRRDYNILEYSVRFWSSYTLQEAVFHCTVDEHTSMDVHFEVLLILAKKRSPFFRGVAKRTKDVIVSKSASDYFYILFLISVGDLKILVQKCPEAIEEALSELVLVKDGKTEFHEQRFLENVNLLVESDDLRDATLDFIHRFNDQSHYFDYLMGGRIWKVVPLKHLCFLLSYGLKLDVSILRRFYNKFGFGELLSFVLEADPRFPIKYIDDPFLRLRYDINCDLGQILRNSDKYRPDNISKLLNYFSHPDLRELCSKDQRSKVAATIANQPDIPRLVELSRNIFRDFFIRTFQIGDARQFRTLIGNLPIANVYKKIIMLEKKLY